MFMPFTKRCIGRFHVVVVQWTSKKCTKKRDACAEQLFARKTNCFLTLKLPILLCGVIWLFDLVNKRFPSCPKLKARLSARPLISFDMNIPFYSHANRTHYHKKVFALSLVLKVKDFKTLKWPIEMAVDEECANDGGCGSILLRG